MPDDSSRGRSATTTDAPDDNPVVAAEAANPRLQQWAGYLRAGGRLVEPADTERLIRARRWNTTVLAVSGALLAIGLVLLLVLLAVPQLRTGVRTAGGLLLVLLGVALVPRMLRIRPNLRHPDAGVAVCAQGIGLPGLGLVAWSDVVGFVYLDNRAWTSRALSVPVTGWASRLALRSGEGSVWLVVGVRDGITLRRRAATEATGPRRTTEVWLYGRGPDGLRAGASRVALDVRLDPEARDRFLAAVRGGAVTARKPFHIARSTIDDGRLLGRMLDPSWPSDR